MPVAVVVRRRIRAEIRPKVVNRPVVEVAGGPGGEGADVVESSLILTESALSVLLIREGACCVTFCSFSGVLA